MSHEPTSRRDALLTLAKTGTAGAMLSAFLTACGSTQQRASKGGTFGDPIPEDPVFVNRPWNPAPSTSRPSTGTATPSPATGVIPRSRWTSAAPRDWLADPMGSVRRITVHHDAIDPMPGTGTDDVARRLDSIRRSHLGRGWADIGYHYAIDPAGRVWEGRPLRLQGAHVADQNPNNLGIVMLGNFERQTPTPQAIEALDRLIAGEMRKYRISIGEVRTHREMAPTACPGRHLQLAMDRTRTRGGRLASLAQGDYRG